MKCRELKSDNNSKNMRLLRPQMMSDIFSRNMSRPTWTRSAIPNYDEKGAYHCSICMMLYNNRNEAIKCAKSHKDEDLSDYGIEN